MCKRERHGAIGLIGALLALVYLACGCAPQSVAPENTAPLGGAAEQQAQAPAMQDPAEKHVHTVIVYVVGSDLESTGGAASLDIAEIAASGAAAQNNVLVVTGGTSAWMLDFIPEDRTMIYRVGDHDMQAIREMPAQNMGSAETLTDCLNFAYENYPGDTYGLVLWDHGAGPMEGVGFDELHEYDSLTLAELREALRASPFGADNKLEWVGLDACLMSSVEAAHVLRDHANYMIASQETEPGYGWNYDFLRALDGNCTGGGEIGKQIIDSYMRYYEKRVAEVSDYDPELTLSCVDLSASGDVEAAVDALFSLADESLLKDAYSQVAKKRNGAKTFGSKIATAEESMDLVDLGDLCAQLNELFPEEAQALEESLERMVVHNASNVRGANGVSIYYPYTNKLLYEHKWKAVYEALDFAPAYTAFMRDFASVWTGERLAKWNLEREAHALPEEENVFCMQLTPEQVQNFAGASYYILQKTEPKEGRDAYIMILASGDVTLNENGLLTAGYDRTMAYMVNEAYDQRVPCILLEIGRDESSIKYKAASRLYYHGMDMTDWAMENAWIHVSYDKQTRIGRITGTTPVMEEGETMYAGKRELDLRAWTSAGFLNGEYMVTYGKDGALLPVLEWDRTDTVRGWGGLTLGNGALHMEKGPVEDMAGEYVCVLEVRDTQGNRYASDLLPVRVEGDASDAAYMRSGTSGAFTYSLYKDKAIITGYSGKDGRVEIPAVLEGQPVTGVAGYTFRGNTALTEIRFPDSLANIGISAFNGCENLRAVELPPGLKTLDSHAFSACTGLESVEIPGSVENIGDSAFSYCRLRKLILGEGVRNIGNQAFEGCKLLTELKLPESLEYIGIGAFDGCIRLRDIHIPAGVKRIRDGAFASYEAYFMGDGISRLERIEVSPENPNYTSVDGVLFDKAGKTLLAYPVGRIGDYAVPDGVEKIADYALCGCGGLMEIALPASLKTVGRFAFAGCTALGAVELPDAVTALGDRAFNSCNILERVSVGKNLSRAGEALFDGCDALKEVSVSPENAHYAAGDKALVKK